MKIKNLYQYERAFYERYCYNKRRNKTKIKIYLDITIYYDYLQIELYDSNDNNKAHCRINLKTQDENYTDDPS
jgi:hypothetical protein